MLARGDQELPNLVEAVANARGRKASKKHFSIAFTADSRIENGDDAAILPGANQTSKALFQRDDHLSLLVAVFWGIAGPEQDVITAPSLPRWTLVLEVTIHRKCFFLLPTDLGFGPCVGASGLPEVREWRGRGVHVWGPRVRDLCTRLRNVPASFRPVCRRCRLARPAFPLWPDQGLVEESAMEDVTVLGPACGCAVCARRLA